MNSSIQTTAYRATRKQASLPASASTTPLRIGAVSYLNSKPLVFGLADMLRPGDMLSLDLPSRLANQLRAGELDVGLVPAVEYLDQPEFEIVSNAVIACRGPVWSVRIFFRGEPSQVQTLALDEGSKTSVALSKVLFHQRFGFIPKTVPLSMQENPNECQADAVLVIGDRAMHPEAYAPHFSSNWDLGQAWFEETGKPFVFAMWVARSKEVIYPELPMVLEQARDHGLAHVREIASATSANYQLSSEQCQDYLTNYIRFYLRNEELAGLEEFGRRCQSLGLISNFTR